jgi:hypothetical protein
VRRQAHLYEEAIMRGSLPVVWSLVLLCGWSIWAAVSERLPVSRARRQAEAVPPPRPLFADSARSGASPVGRAARVDPRLLPN